MAEPRRGGIGAALAAAEAKSRRSLLRNHGGGHAPVSFLELFFDLVFVFAITQLSHFLKDHLTWLGFAQALVLFLAVWWAWMYTTWATNWADPERFEVRVMLLVLMALSLLMAVALPYGFSKYAGLFALSYVALQIGRTVFMALILRTENPRNGRNMMRIGVWFCLSALFWLIGVLRPEEERLGWWGLAVAIEYLGPITLFPVPLLGRSSPADWDISGSHMAERCGLFIIIALGEGIIITGATFANADKALGPALAFALAFMSSVLMWWLYFDLGQKRGSEHISSNAEVGRVGRSAYTYLHMPIVLGIVVTAVADAKLLAMWDQPADGKLALTLCGGAVVFLSGLGLFKRHSNPLGNFPLSHGIGAILFLALGYVAWQGGLTTLQVGGLGVAALAAVSGWEWVSYHGGWKERIDDTLAWIRLAR
ncbi:low temperature requirement protein A [Novosphingobium sp.]|uniref:low temperature requirement protein A n=1 Tax=Novosphingobium sp. TaxID=1874826 RepID=UPI0022C1EA5E|nr:low temperature requirement protein A [Novosphingobium sp.]MCZ8019580.1 low temperature requirement protein A [Novosphingobium sp.]MCZ8035395.1 low temperature requirement protein A [Novosphingobium sp.]MCZ8050709.1 low temperature requirement protein A [Novosphingobium sp.]MCZ8059055.1 low temperature requirement protein A [Novosphingobium sp.]MCZ8232501.1 low temperature requirement protein A [Novosphingobium sp.]